AMAYVTYLTHQEAHSGGLQLGSRYLLPVAPLLLIAAADQIRRQPIGTALAAIGLFCLSLYATRINLIAERRVRAENRNVLRAVERTGIHDVVTSFFWAPQILAPLSLDRRIFGVGPYDEPFLANLVKHGVGKVVRVHGGLREYRGHEVIVKLEDVLVP